jgi:hypothetical protein
MNIFDWLADRFGTRGRPDPEALFADLARAHSGIAYKDADRYRDFRQVFLDTAQGRRVLYEIFTWANLFRTVFIPGDPYATHYRDGERNIALKILATLNAEPAEPPAEAEHDTTQMES